MATARAIANGNWSNTATWNGGVLPGNGDTVYANGFNVTINQDINIGGANNPTVNAGSFVAGQWYEIDFVGTTNFTTIGAASNTNGTIFLATGVGSGTGTAKAIATLTTAANTAAGATGGAGAFLMPTVYSLNCDIRAGTSICLSLTATSGTLSLNNIKIFGGSSSGAHGINTSAGSLWSASGCLFTGSGVAAASALNNASTGTVIVTSGCTFNGGVSVNGSALNNASTGTINVTGSNTFTAGTTTGTFALNNASTGTINVTGSCTFTSGSSTAIALNNASTGTINVTGSCTFNATSAAALNNASTGSVIVSNSTFVASAFTNAVIASNTSADVRLSGDFLDHWSGWRAVNCPKFRLGTTPAAARHQMALAGTTDSYVNFYTADNTGFGLPSAMDVRSGVSYGGGAVAGTCAVPAAGSVSLGVPVDATTGTAVLTAADVQSALTAQGLTTARAGNLDNLDATVSSRLAPNGTLATVTTLTNAPDVPTEGEIASAVWSAASREITGGVVDTLTNAPASVTPSDIWSHAARTLTSASGPTAVEIRQEMDSNSTKLSAIKGKTDNLPADPADQSLLEAAIAGVAAPSAATVASAVRSELSTELTKVSALNTERLANVATTAIVGNLIAQANS